MTPTNELRFVERPIVINECIKLVRILQQKWEKRLGEFSMRYEWRDVPCVKEAA